MIKNFRRAEMLYGLLSIMLAVSLISFTAASFAATEGQGPARPVEPAMQEIEESAKKAPPKELAESDPNLQQLDRIMERWSLSERELIEMMATTLRKGGSRLSWPYFLAGGRLNLLWQKQGLPIGSLEVAEKKFMPIVTNGVLPEQMRLNYASQVEMRLQNAWNKKEPMPESLRKAYAQAMGRVVVSASDREFREHAIEACIMFGGDISEAREAVLWTTRHPDSEVRKWFLWRARFGSTKYGVLSSPLRKELIAVIGQHLIEAESKHDEDTLDKAISSALSIANHSKDRQERGNVINWLGGVIKNSKSPRVRFRAFQALKEDAFFGELYKSASPDEKEKIDAAVRGYDPQPDRDVSSGGKGRKDK